MSPTDPDTRKLVLHLAQSVLGLRQAIIGLIAVAKPDADSAEWKSIEEGMQASRDALQAMLADMSGPNEDDLA